MHTLHNIVGDRPALRDWLITSTGIAACHCGRSTLQRKIHASAANEWYVVWLQHIQQLGEPLPCIKNNSLKAESLCLPQNRVIGLTKHCPTSPADDTMLTNTSIWFISVGFETRGPMPKQQTTSRKLANVMSRCQKHLFWFIRLHQHQPLLDTQVHRC